MSGPTWHRRSRGGRLLLAAWSLAGAGAAVAAPVFQPGEGGLGRALSDVSEEWIHRGEDEPVAVLAELEHAPPPASGVSVIEWQRMRARTRGLVAARSGMEDDVRRALETLASLAADSAGCPLPRRAARDQALIQAVLQDLLGHPVEAARQGAWPTRPTTRPAARVSPRPIATTGPGGGPCICRRSAPRCGDLVEALNLAERAHAVAELGLDPGLEGWSLAMQAVYQQALNHPDQARALMAQADRVVRRHGDALLIWVRFAEARLALEGGRHHRPAADAAGPAPGRTAAPRLQARILPSLSDLLRRAGRPREALQAVEQAYPVLRRHQELRGQPTLLHNGGWPRCSWARWPRAGPIWRPPQALGTTGARPPCGWLCRKAPTRWPRSAMCGALDLLHREQALRAEINADNQAAILAQMRATYRAEAERRELDLLERENALRSSHLQTQTLIERIWVAAIVLLGLAGGWWGCCARDATRRLRHSEALLRVQSERDPLTGLANRRHFREVLATRACGLPRRAAAGGCGPFQAHQRRVRPPRGRCGADRGGPPAGQPVRAAIWSAAGAGGVPDLRAGPAGGGPGRAGPAGAARAGR
jgi:hypothetical protein